MAMNGIDKDEKILKNNNSNINNDNSDSCFTCDSESFY